MRHLVNLLLVARSLLIGMAMSLLSAVAPVAAQAPANVAGDAHLMPPAAVGCNRNQLTSHTGEVTGYIREPGVTSLTIHTDRGTAETVVIKHPGSDNPSARFLIEGRPFTADDWAFIEAARGVIRDGIRATAWACSDGVTSALVDWQLPPG